MKNFFKLFILIILSINLVSAQEDDLVKVSFEDINFDRVPIFTDDEKFYIPSSVKIKSRSVSSATYGIIPANTCVTAFSYSNSSNVTQYFRVIFSSDVRYVILSNGNNSYSSFFESLSVFDYKFATNSNPNYPCSTPNNTATSSVYDGQYLYYRATHTDTVDSNYLSDYPIILDENMTISSNTAYRYTFGDLSVDPVPPSNTPFLLDIIDVYFDSLMIFLNSDFMTDYAVLFVFILGFSFILLFKKVLIR